MAPRWLKRIRRLRRRHPSWGSRKLAACLRKAHRGGQAPSIRTVSNWLKGTGLNRRPSRRGTRRGPGLKRPRLTVAQRPNQVWTVDFKGWFCTQEGCRVEPLTVRDLFSRCMLSIRLLRNQSWGPVRREFL
jgi:transposase InsO family protein